MKNEFNVAAEAPLSEAEQALKKWGAEYEKRPDGTLFVRGSMAVRDEDLTALPDMSAVIVEEDFWCTNTMLRTLKGAPRYVGGSFYCAKCDLVSLEGAPEIIGGGFYCANNRITSLEHAPRKINGDFKCHGNPLTSLEWMPEGVKAVDSDLGKFTSWDEVPSALRVSDKTVEEATVLQRDLKVGMALRLKHPLLSYSVFQTGLLAPAR